MKLVVWLGNPGREYQSTRHNIGFLFLDFLQNQLAFPDFRESQFFGLTSEVLWQGEKYIFLKPTTFMNVSGKSVRAVVNFYKLDPARDIVVVYDDVSMEFWKIRFRDTGSAGGHNGIKSLIENVWESFWRIKIGVGDREHGTLSDWVLWKFSQEEKKALESVFGEAKNMLEKRNA